MTALRMSGDFGTTLYEQLLFVLETGEMNRFLRQKTNAVIEYYRDLHLGSQF